MRRSINLNENWIFTEKDGKKATVNVPHTWNAIDGQDGGNDYARGTRLYEKQFQRPEFVRAEECVYLEFLGVNASANVLLNGTKVCSHAGGYSTFRAEITDLLKETNELKVEVDNSVNKTVYPQRADFTFYGGIYRDVNLVTVSKNHFDLDYFGGTGIKVTPVISGTDAVVKVESYTNCEGKQVRVSILDQAGVVVCTEDGVCAAAGCELALKIPRVHLWEGVKDPYLYQAKAELIENGVTIDEVLTRFGVRSFHIDPDKGFFLNGASYPLRGVSRHQDRKAIGNAISKAQHQEDMELIREIGANTIRLAHYQHDQYFYDLCDEYGFIVWAEIPYISEHMPEGRANTISQMTELIVQNYNHPSIITWGLSNEITIGKRNRKDMMDNHRQLNDLCHEMDETRPTSLACYATCPMFYPVVHVSDLVSYNLYLGWYVPGLFLNDVFMDLFHLIYPKRCLGYSEYGAEGMPNLHSSRPKRGDHTEEYQAIYHEYMLRCFDRHPFLWSTHVWNMFDFAADARDQGGEAGMNHKGLITFDRKIKKDSFYLYKAWWSEEAFVHLCGKRYQDRTEAVTTIKVYSNQKKVALYNNGVFVEEQSGSHVFTFQVKLEPENKIEVVAGECRDSAVIYKKQHENPEYRLKKGKSKNWV